jgi:ribosomal protein S6E (S10)
MAKRMAGDVDVLRLLAEDRGGRDEQGRPMYLSDEDQGFDQYGNVMALPSQEIADNEAEMNRLIEQKIQSFMAEGLSFSDAFFAAMNPQLSRGEILELMGRLNNG